MKKVNIILPTYNESANIARLIERLFMVEKQENSNYQFDILVVDDNSPDGTGDIVTQIKNTNSRVHLIKGVKAGLGKAYVRGFKYSLKHLKPDVVVMMDADFSHNPDSLPKMLRAINKGGDYVIGSRYTSGGSIPGDWPLLRILNSRAANFVAHKVGGVDAKIKDSTGGFKAIKASALRSIKFAKFNTNGYAFQMRLLNEFAKMKFKIIEVPIVFSDRQFGYSKLRLADIIEFFKCAYGLNPDSPFKQLLRFAGVGISGIFVNLMVLFLLKNYTDIGLIASSAAAIEVSIITNFLLHSFFTFKNDREFSLATKNEEFKETDLWHLKFIKFNIAVLGIAGLTLANFALLNQVFGIYYLLAQSLAIGISFFVNYWFSKKYVWSQGRRREDGVAGPRNFSAEKYS